MVNEGEASLFTNNCRKGKIPHFKNYFSIVLFEKKFQLKYIKRFFFKVYFCS